MTGRGAKIAFVGAVFGWAAVFCYSIHVQLPFNPMRLPFESKVPIVAILPQGWGFFTREPREPNVQAFTRRDGRPLLTDSNAGPSNFFGLSRRPRALGVELGLILSSIREEQWKKQTTPLTIHNPTPEPTLCGNLTLVRRPPLPWAWSRSKRPVTMPAETVQVDVLCSQN